MFLPLKVTCQVRSISVQIHIRTENKKKNWQPKMSLKSQYNKIRDNARMFYPYGALAFLAYLL
jgi:hypothetical protein